MSPERKAALLAEAEQLRALVRPAQERLAQINAELAADRQRAAYALSARSREERLARAAQQRAAEARNPRDPRLPRGDE